MFQLSPITADSMPASWSRSWLRIICASAASPATLNFSAKRHLPRDLESAGHAWMMPEREHVYLNIDLGQTGVGGDNSWGAREHPQFRLTGSHCFEYRITPVTRSAETAQKESE